MQVAVLVKIVADDQDLGFDGQGNLDFSRAQNIISTYDLNAIEAAVSFAEAVGDSSVKAYMIGGSQIDDSKLKKNVLSRGVSELFIYADEQTRDLDARATASLLADLLEKSGGADLIVAGDGSADRYAQQVDVQLASMLDLPYVSGVIKIENDGDALKIERLLETTTETLKINGQAVIAVSPDIAEPRIAGMKDILAAGKKPANLISLSEAGDVAQNVTETTFERQPVQTARDLELFTQANEGDLEKFVAAVKTAL